MLHAALKVSARNCTGTSMICAVQQRCCATKHVVTLLIVVPRPEAMQSPDAGDSVPADPQ